MIGNGIGVYAENGKKFLVITWIGWALLQVANVYWFLVW